MAIEIDDERVVELVRKIGAETGETDEEVIRRVVEEKLLRLRRAGPSPSMRPDEETG